MLSNTTNQPKSTVELGPHEGFDALKHYESTEVDRRTWPPWGPGGLSRECVLRIPSVIVKGD